MASDSKSSSKKADKRAKNIAANKQGFFTLDRQLIGLGAFFFLLLVLAFKGIITHNEAAQGSANRSSGAAPSGTNKLPLVDIADSAKLKEIFLSGEPYVVHCVSDSTEESGTPDRINDLYTSDAIAGLKFARVNCWRATESGKTLAERFKLPRFDPVSITIANTLPAQVIKVKTTAEKVEKQIREQIKPQAVQIKSLQSWEKHCRRRTKCLIVSGRKGAGRLEAVDKMIPALERHRALRMVNVDTGFWQVKLEDGVLATRPEKEKGIADAICIVKRENGDIFGKFLSAWEDDVVKQFVADCDKMGDSTWPEQLQSVDIIARSTLKDKKPKVEEEDELDGSSAPKRDRVGSREGLDDEEDEDEGFTDEEREEEEEDDGEDVEL